MATCSQVLSHIKSSYGMAEFYHPQIQSNKTQAYSSWIGGDDHAAINHLINALAPIIWIFSELIDADYPSTNDFALWYYIKNCTGGGTPPPVTLADILSAMMTASNEEYKSFIGIVDAYRVALWNKPFNVEFYAALARGFAE